MYSILSHLGNNGFDVRYAKIGRRTNGHEMIIDCDTGCIRVDCDDTFNLLLSSQHEHRMFQTILVSSEKTPLQQIQLSATHKPRV